MAFLNVVIFIFLCMLHFYWLFGGRWGMDFAVPTKEKSADKLFKPSAISTLVVAVGFLCFAFVAIGDTGIFSDWIE
ncbi:MAG: DUF3995 domain-containing protein, partial [Bacteroidia bacterium]|nr:DUF3995 domain-containing protein [Bacteroidia bacterium]